LVYAIVESGGVQFRVAPNETLQVPRVEGEIGCELKFPKVLLLAEEGRVLVGSPVVEGAEVWAKILSHGRTPKILGFKYKRRKNYRRRWGIRSEFSKLLITNIVSPFSKEVEVTKTLEPAPPEEELMRPLSEEKGPKKEKEKVAPRKITKITKKKPPKEEKVEKKKRVKTLISKLRKKR